MKPDRMGCTAWSAAWSSAGSAAAEEVEGAWPLATMPLLGRVSSTAVSRRAAFSWVNQSVFCSSLQPAGVAVGML